MLFSLIICTYHRPESLLRLLGSVVQQTVVPDQIIIVDGSLDDVTQQLSLSDKYRNLEYFKVSDEDRGLTRQRNYGVRKVNQSSEVIFFLDDDTLLEPDYFSEILHTYEKFPTAVGVSGYIINEVDWKEVRDKNTPGKGKFVYDGWFRTEGSRFILRRKFNLAPTAPPGFMPDFSHGYSIGFLPPTGKTYEVELLMGGIASYRRSIFDKIGFSAYFEGYGLYEDADFSLRASKLGKLYVNTNARLEHHHAPQGRPDMYKYGSMVLRNGWYVWRLKNPRPGLKARVKWHATSFLLTLVRFSNVLSNSQRKVALMEGVGRCAGWLSLLFKKPHIKR